MLQSICIIFMNWDVSKCQNKSFMPYSFKCITLFMMKQLIHQQV